MMNRLNSLPRTFKVLIIASMLCLSMMSLHADNGFSLGIEGGYSLTLVHTRTSWSNTYNYPFHSFDTTVTAEYRFLDRMAVDVGVRYIMKSSRYVHRATSSGTLTTVDNYIKMNHFIEFPITFRYYFNVYRPFELFAGGGFYLGYRLFEMHSGRIMTVMNGSQSYTRILDFNSGDNRFDAGLIAEGGISFDFDYAYFLLTLRYQYGLTSLAKGQSSGMNTYLDNITTNAGILFKF